MLIVKTMQFLQFKTMTDCSIEPLQKYILRTDIVWWIWAEAEVFADMLV